MPKFRKKPVVVEAERCEERTEIETYDTGMRTEEQKARSRENARRYRERHPEAAREASPETLALWRYTEEADDAKVSEEACSD